MQRLAKGEVAMEFLAGRRCAGGVREGKLVALAVTAWKRSTHAAAAATMAEAGIDKMESAAWFGFGACGMSSSLREQDRRRYRQGDGCA